MRRTGTINPNLEDSVNASALMKMQTQGRADSIITNETKMTPAIVAEAEETKVARQPEIVTPPRQLVEVQQSH